MTLQRGQRYRGLSPRVRGNHYYLRRGQWRPWSIPACAGEPKCPPLLPEVGKVYPRVCGGTAVGKGIVIRRRGLSPRVRGNRGRAARGGDGGRSIPACAGEPPIALGGALLVAVYPRVCGGTAVRERGYLLTEGLSPRVRGNRIPGRSGAYQDGSIPACAGEPALPARTPSPARVYPRVCGGTLASPPAAHTRTGLSPRVRGNPRRNWKSTSHKGSIPACAGEPAGQPSRRIPGRVYPRVCGGT